MRPMRNASRSAILSHCWLPLAFNAKMLMLANLRTSATKRKRAGASRRVQARNQSMAKRRFETRCTAGTVDLSVPLVPRITYHLSMMTDHTLSLPLLTEKSLCCEGARAIDRISASRIA